MSRAATVVALLAAAALLHVGVARPARQRSLELGREEARLHGQLREQRLRLAQTTRQALRIEASHARLAQAPAIERDRAPATVRATIVALLAGRPLEDVRLEVRPATGAAVAEFDVSALAPSTGEALRFAAALTDAADARVATAVEISAAEGGRHIRVRGFRWQPAAAPARGSR